MEETVTSVAELLTVIITTSATPSAPSPELLSSILTSFRQHCPALLTCRVIVVLDGYDQVVAHPRLKKGCVTAGQARDFELYKHNVRELMLDQYGEGEGAELIYSDGEAEYGSPMISTNVVPFTASQTIDKRVAFVESSRRLGFGLAVRTALRMTKTPYVWIQQHDWSLVADVPISSFLKVMKTSETDADAPIKYICLPAVRMLGYAASADAQDFPALKELTVSFKGSFPVVGQPEIRIPLTPLFFWHDKPHIASTTHYLARVFPTRLAMMRGDFIEDKIGQRARNQMKAGLWRKWATWLYYPKEGEQLCVRHLHGRVRLGAEAQAKLVASYREQNHQKVSEGRDEVADSSDSEEGLDISEIYSPSNE